MKLKSVIVVPPSNKRDLFTNCNISNVGKVKPKKNVTKSKVKKALKKIRKQKTARQTKGQINW